MSLWDLGREPTHARDKFFSGQQAMEHAVRASILASWERCQSKGLMPDDSLLPYYPDIESEELLMRAAAPVLERLHAMLADTRMVVLLADGDARVLTRRAGGAGLNRHLDAIQLAAGFSFAEDHAGTNGIGTALAENRRSMVYAGEHFAERFVAFACAGTPIRDPLSGEVRGAIDLTAWHRDASPLMLVVAEQAALAIQGRLLEQYSLRERSSHDAALRNASLVPWPNPSPRPWLPSGSAPVPIPSPRSRLAAGPSSVSPPTTSAPLTSPTSPTSHGPLPLPQLKLHPESEPRHVEPGRRGLPRPTAGETEVAHVAHAARERLALLLDASGRIGTTLDVRLTAEELTEVALPDFAQRVTVDLAEWVLDGEESAPSTTRLKLRRTAARILRGDTSPLPVGMPVSYSRDSAQSYCLAEERAVLDASLSGTVSRDDYAPGPRMRSVIAVPISAQGAVMGVASFYRSRYAEPFAADDLALAEELVARAAVCLDNARRFAREHAMALTLQRSLLPRALPDQYAVEVAYRYLPAQEGVGGDWFDVIPLSGGRVALVVGDVVGHGIHAAATMGRLRTAVRNFAALDLTPEDLLGQLDALVDSMDQEEADDKRGVGIIGATCLYVVYDPISGHSTMAAAGHPSPALVAPDGTVGVIDLPTGPPLGLGGTTFEAVELALPEDSRIVLFTDGLVEHRDRDIDVGIERLNTVLAGPGRSPEEMCEAVIRELMPQQPWDDSALLIARTRRTDAQRVAIWDVEHSPSAVPGIRAEVSRQLSAWGLQDVVFTAELLVSELVTNAIRHATGPVELRLLRDRALICEVADGSSISPRLRRAHSMDEGGRGLFLVAQLAQRWGTRYTTTGKVIWAEVALPLS